MNSKKVRVVLHTSGMSVPDKFNFGQDVTQALTSNAAVFSSPGSIVTGLSNATQALQTAWNAARDGGKTLTAQMHDKERLFDEALQKAAHYVEDVANGDEEIIHLAMLAVRPVTSPPKNSLGVKAGSESGEVILTCESHRGAVYLWQYSTDPANPGAWMSLAPATGSRQKRDGFTPGTRYWFRSTWLDKEGSHPYSDPLSIIVV